MDTKTTQTDIASLEVPLERDGFLRSLVRELAGTLEETIGLEETSGFISVVGQRIGDHIDSDYKKALGVSKLDKQQVIMVLEDLKKRILGDFYVIEESESKVVFGNRKCPFAEKVKGRPSMCMMTSNVFGTISAASLGYAKISLDKTIERGDPECRVVVYFDEQSTEAKANNGIEYFD